MAITIECDLIFALQERLDAYPLRTNCARGADTVHNLKNIDFEIPHNQVTVGTGISARGMGPWSFDTIYAEALCGVALGMPGSF
jgi:hypothetical protein